MIFTSSSWVAHQAGTTWASCSALRFFFNRICTRWWSWSALSMTLSSHNFPNLLFGSFDTGPPCMLLYTRIQSCGLVPSKSDHSMSWPNSIFKKGSSFPAPCPVKSHHYVFIPSIVATIFAVSCIRNSGPHSVDRGQLDTREEKHQTSQTSHQTWVQLLNLFHLFGFHQISIHQPFFPFKSISL
jgi:hypothetical protein